MLSLLLYLTCTTVCAQLPESFRNTLPNELINGEFLRTLNQVPTDSSFHLKVMHIGDSHVRGNFFPKALGKVLTDSLEADFAYYGINGAQASRFLEPDLIEKVASEQPHLIVISFGTNEAHSPHYNADDQTMVLALLVDSLTRACNSSGTPQFLFTTPPGSYLRQRTGRYYRNRRGRRVYYYRHSNNETTPLVADNIVNFSKVNNFPAWDIFNIAGGREHACENWKNSNLMNNDQIHYTAAGYTLMGEMLGQAIVKAIKKPSPLDPHP